MSNGIALQGYPPARREEVPRSHGVVSHGGRIIRQTRSVLMVMMMTVSSLTAQNVGKISGVVRDAETNEPLIGCNVSVEGTTLGASTDPDGAYFILNVPPGKYDIQASLIGYQRVLQKGAVVNSGRTTTADFRLRSEVMVQEEVIVVATRPDVEREKTSTSAIVRAEEVQTVAGIRDVGDVLNLAADVTDGHFRGGREGEEYYTLQGMGIVNPLDNSSAFLPIMSAVEEVEVITSGFGAQYGNAQSGVVNISMKEGKADQWRSRFEMRLRAPGRKHFGASAYDPSANPYLALLLNPNVWLQGDPNSDNAQPYYGSMGSGLTSRYARDTLVQVAVARALWMQTRRDLDRTYGQNVDYSVEAAAGGPVEDGLRMFIALRSSITWPVFLTEQPDIERQFLGNIVADLSPTSALRISGGYTEETSTDFPSENSTSGYQRWLWDRITGVRSQKRTNLQLGTRFTHTLSPSTFYELKINSLFTKNKIGSTPVPSSLPDSVSVAWSFILPVRNGNSPDRIDYQEGYDEFRTEPTTTISFDGSITSQVTRSHLLNAGFQLNTYHLDLSNVLQLRTNYYVERYKATPLEAALYLQDKMEFEGFIANAGVRLDVWKSGAQYYTDPYVPFGLADSTGQFDPASASRADAPILGRIQPRVGVSFPVSVNTVFHLNYGAFMQRPSLQYVVSTRVAELNNRPVILGNPRLLPQITNSYDIGVTQGLGEGFTLDVSGYYKDVKNLLQQADFTNDITPELVSSYYNLDYADIRGFRLALTKRRGAISGSVNYQYSVATGKSATVTAATPAFNRDMNGGVTTDLSNVPIRDILLDFDRTHNLIVNLAYVTDPEWGPEVLGGHPLADITLSVLSSFRSGRPYTSPSNLKLINSRRSPNEYNTNARLTKRIRDFFGVNATFYVEVFNLFDDRILNYDYVFARPTSTNPNLALSYYEKYGIDDPGNGIRYWWDKGKQGPFAVDQSFLIYENQPRSFSFGFAIDL